MSILPSLRPVAPVVAVDIGNVCHHLDFAACSRISGIENFWYGSLLHNPESLRLEHLVEKGLLPIPEFLTRTARALALPEAQLQAAWTGIIGTEMPGMPELIDEMLAAGLRPVFFSNISWLHWRHSLAAISFGHKMHGAVLSCEAQAIKPEPAIYETMERRYCGGGIPCLYLDDRPENIEGGRQRGWNSHLFIDAAGARQALREVLRTL